MLTGYLPESEANEVRLDGGVQPGPFGLPAAKLRDRALRLVLDRLVVFGPMHCARKAALGRYVTVLPDFLQRRGLAAAGHGGVVVRLDILSRVDLHS